MKPYKVLENFLDREYFDKLKHTLTSSDFAWFYAPRSGNGDNHFDFDFMFVHSFFHFKNDLDMSKS